MLDFAKLVEGVVDAVLAVSAREIGSWILNFETRLENPALLSLSPPSDVFTVEWTNKGSTNEARARYHRDLREDTSENTITEKGNERCDKNGIFELSNILCIQRY